MLKSGKGKLLVGMFLLIQLLCMGNKPLWSETLLTVSGIVFNDRNNNGTRDEGEKELSNVIVSDGLNCILTDLNGHYRFETNRDRTRFVFVVAPNGYKSSQDFYIRLPPGTKEFTANFALSTSPETKNSNFSFVDISDTHIGMWGKASKTFSEDLKEIEPLKPAFIVNTGDLTTKGQVYQYEFYKKTIENFSIPIYSVVGNHDTAGNRTIRSAEDIKNYEDFLGPTYYSFNYGRRHFVVLNSMFDINQQLEWLKKDLSLQPKETEILVFQHYPPKKWLLDFLAGYNTRAIFSGHYHSSKVFQYKKILYVNTPPLRFGGIGISPRGFRMVSFRDGELILDDRYGGRKQYLTIVSPADGAVLSKRKVKIKANVYDVSSTVRKVEYRIDKEPWKEMVSVSRWTWESEWAGETAGDHIIKVRTNWDSGAVLEKQAAFKISDGIFPSPKSGSDWPMFQHDPARTGAAADSVVPPLYLAWSKTLGGEIHISSPVIAYETVYIGVQDEEMKGKAGVYALDAGTGEVKWRYKTDASIKNTVVVSDNLVYVVSVDGKVYALDAKTGHEKWNYSLSNGVDNWVYSSPVISDNVVYLGDARNFVALDSQTGERLWQKGSGGVRIPCYSSPAIGKGKVYVGFSWSNGLMALDKDTGEQIWGRKKGVNKSNTAPTFFKDILYYPAETKLYALNPESGEELWSLPLRGALWAPMSSPAVSDSKLYIGSPDGSVLALNALTGEELWSYKTGKAILSFNAYVRGGSSIISSPALSDNVVYIGSNDGKFYALDTVKGGKIWSYNLGSPITSSPAVSGNTVYIGAYDGTIYAFTQKR